MTMDTLLLLALAAMALSLIWAVMRANELYDMVAQLQESLAAIADGKANVQRYNDKIVITHKED
jgi:hypothetical protein